jgi:adenosylcobinamide-phosphate synthase
MPNAQYIILILAAILDYLIGDPWGWIHPVQVMGWIISKYSEFVINYFTSKIVRKIAGIILGFGLIISSGIIAWLLIQLTIKINYWLAIAVQVIILASCFAAHSLKLAALDVLKPLKEGDLAQAKAKLSLYVGRDTHNLSPSEILRAVLETVAENTTDGVTAPLFYAILGALIPTIGSVPLAIAYKSSSTLDSMIGYKKEPYTDLGWFSAKLEDYLTFIPCRLTVLTLALISGKPKEVIALCIIDANKDPSPNSGWSECAYAAILEVQLGGENTYQGIVKLKPLLGKPNQPITEDKIYKALQLTRFCFLIWLTIGLVFCYIMA